MKTWIIMPVLAHRDYTVAAISDCLGQTLPARILIVNQGVDEDFRTELETLAEQSEGRILLWSHNPPLLSLAATWNLALRTAWASGAERALVVNNDVRLHRDTTQVLSTVLVRTSALFVSAVGVTAEQFHPEAKWRGHGDVTIDWEIQPHEKGGPDFSCFLISKECHQRFQFDEGFVPAFCEDLDYHRRLMLAGEGQRIFSINLPYLHYASATLKTLDQDRANRIRHQIEVNSRAYYARKWGGVVNQETFVLPFRLTETRDVTTPALQRMYREDHREALPHVEPTWFEGQGNDEPPARRKGQSRLVGRPLDEEGAIELTREESTEISRMYVAEVLGKSTVLKDPEPESESLAEIMPRIESGE